MNLAPWLVAVAAATQLSSPSPSGDSAFTRGDFTAAFQSYSAAVAASPRDFDALLGLGTVDLYRGDLPAARTYLTRAAQIDPSDGRVQRSLRAMHEIQDVSGDFDVSIRREVDVPFVATDPLPMVSAKIDGKAGLFLIDTGAPGVELSAAAARRLGVRMHAAGEGVFVGGMKAPIFAGRVDSLEFPGAVIHGVPVGQLPAAMPVELGGRSYDGVIGTKLLRRFLSTIDYRDGRLILRPRSDSERFEAAALAQNAAIVPMWMVPDHFIFARATVNGRFDGLFSIDTGGAGVGIVLTKTALSEAKITPDDSKATSGVGGGGAVRVVPFSAETVSLGSLTRKSVPGLFTPAGDPYGMFSFTVAGALSHEFFRSSAVTFDFDAMKLVLS